MNSPSRQGAPSPARRWTPVLFTAALLLAGCATGVPRPAPALTTRIGTAPVILPAEMYGNILVVEAKWDRYGPYHFLIDTGSSVTLVTPELAARYGMTADFIAKGAPVRVRSADGNTTLLTRTLLDRLDLGGARYGHVPALIYDCSPISSQLGVKVDGVLGFSLFRDTLLTLDYPRNCVVLQAVAPTAPRRPARPSPSTTRTRSR